MRKWLLMQRQQYRKAFDAKDENAAARVPTILLINQVRLKIGVMYGDPETTPGGMSTLFATSARVRTSSGKIEGQDKDDKNLSLHNLRFKVKKSGVSASGYDGEYKLIQHNTEFHKAGEIDQDDMLAKYALRSGIVTGTPNAYVMESCLVPEDGETEIKPKKFRGVSQIELALAQDKALANRVYDEIVLRMTGTKYSGVDGAVLWP